MTPIRPAPLVLALALAAAPAAARDDLGASTTVEPYLVASQPGVAIRSILAVGEAAPSGYRLVGIPDGHGALDNGDGTFTLLVNHELRESAGVVRRHGARGAFVSRWTLRARDLAVLAGGDFLQRPADLHLFDRTSGAWRAGAGALARFCSADLAPASAFSFGALGTADRIFLNGEESAPPFAGDHGRAFAWIATGAHAGEARELPRLGRIAFENVLASPHPQRKTVVVGMDDAGLGTDVRDPGDVCTARGQGGCTQPPSELYVYVGTKQAQGHPVERAGLANGRLHGVRVVAGGAPVAGEDKASALGGAGGARLTRARFALHDFGDVSKTSGNALQAASIEALVTQFFRIEDGAWDPRPAFRNDFYFVTTGRLHADPARYLPSRLWRLRFDDVERPEAGGEIALVLDSADPAGKPGFEMLDNIGMDRHGRILMQEDPGATPRLARVWLYDTTSGRLVQVAEHNPKFFAPGGAAFLTVDEESSGVVDASTILGEGWFLATVQSHHDANDPELVQGGQLLAIRVPLALGR